MTPLNDQSASWQQWTDTMRIQGRIVPDGAGGEFILGTHGQVVGGISSCSFPDLNAPNREELLVNPDQLRFKLAKLAAGLESDLHSVDCLTYDHFALKQQRLQLITETLDQVAQLLGPTTCAYCCSRTNKELNYHLPAQCRENRRVSKPATAHTGYVPSKSDFHAPDSMKDHGA